MRFFLRLGAVLLSFGAASFEAFLRTLFSRDRTTVPKAYGGAIRRWMWPVIGLDVEVIGEANLRAARPCVYVVNHQSAMDVPILSVVFPEETVLIAKKELRRIPFFGWVYEATGNIFIDRKNNKGSIQRLREAQDAIRERGVSVWIFPEGTRGKVPGELLPFKKGAFFLAIGAGVPIVPIVVSPVAPLFSLSERVMVPGIAQIQVLPPIPTEGLEDSDVPDLIRRTHAAMSEALRQSITRPRGGKAFSPALSRGPRNAGSRAPGSE